MYCKTQTDFGSKRLKSVLNSVNFCDKNNDCIGFGFSTIVSQKLNNSLDSSLESNMDSNEDNSDQLNVCPIGDISQEICFEDKANKGFKKFSVERYRQLLKAWNTAPDEVSIDSGFCSRDQSRDYQSMDTTDDSNPSTGLPVESQSMDRTDDNQLIDEMDNTLNKTIDLNDSLESIPETPLIVEKRRKLDQKKRKTNKRFISEFIDFESEVALDSSQSLTDDIESTQRELETMSGTSGIDNNTFIDTQPVGQLIGGIDSRNSEDMQSVYLRSIKEQTIGKSEKYKLQFNYDPNIEVYSQEPNEEDLKDYEFDDFCVPNDCVIYEESPQMTTNLKQTSETPSPRMRLRSRKKFKRIIVFSP